MTDDTDIDDELLSVVLDRIHDRWPTVDLSDGSEPRKNVELVVLIAETVYEHRESMTYTCPTCEYETDSKDDLIDDGTRGGHADQWWRSCPECGDRHQAMGWSLGPEHHD